MKTIQQRENYRERLYRHYLATQSGTDLVAARRALHASAPYLKKLIAAHVPQDRDLRILDLGCGFGALLYWLQQAGYTDLRGVDLSAEQVDGAHELGLNFVERDDLMAYLARTPSQSCDIVFAFDVIEHFGKEEALEFADEVFRILRPGGRFIVHTPNGEGIFSSSAAGDFTHELILSGRSLGQMLRCAGFSRVACQEDLPVVHGIVSGVRYLIWKIFRSVMRLGHAAETGELERDLILTQNFLTVAKKPHDQ